MELVTTELLGISAIVISAVIGYVVTLLRRLILEKVAKEQLQGLLLRLTEGAAIAVRETYQRWVEAAKAEGKFDDEAKERARKEALDYLKTYIGPKGLTLLSYILGFNTEVELEKLLTGRIESAIAEEKNPFA